MTIEKTIATNELKRLKARRELLKQYLNCPSMAPYFGVIRASIASLESQALKLYRAEGLKLNRETGKVLAR